jgi:phosphoglycerate-specific signal transduction histidine kinase
LFDIDENIKKLEKGLNGEVQVTNQDCHEVLARMNESIIAMIDVSREIWILGSNFHRYTDDVKDNGNVAQSSEHNFVSMDLSRTFMFTQSPTWFF